MLVFGNQQVTPDITFRDAGLCVQRSHDQQLQTKFAKQLQRVLRILVVNLAEHFIDHYKVKAVAVVVARFDVVLVGDRGHQNGKGQLGFFPP